jgi:hypothetical protein
MKKMTQADRDAGLTQADVDAGLRAGKQSSITDAERESAIARANRLDAESIVDKYRDYNKNPAAQAMPVDMGSRATPRAAPRVRPSAMAEEGPSPVPGTQMAETEPGATMPRSASRPRVREDGQTLFDMIRGNMNRPSPYRRGTRTEADDIPGAKRGGSVNKMAKKKSSVSSASKRGDGIASRGKTKGRMI